MLGILFYETQCSWLHKVLSHVIPDYPPSGCDQVTWPSSTFWGPGHICGADEARRFKFGLCIEHKELELVDKFCYLGDMLSVDWDADATVEARIRIGWSKFRQMVPLLTNKDVTLIMRGRLYSSYVRSIMLHGSETWPVTKENVVALHRT